LQTFLNITDGVKELTGIFLIFTTNYFEKLDDALVRDGRIDFKINFKLASKDIIKKILQHRYKLHNIDKYIEHINISDEVLSIATIIKICKQNSNDIINCISEIELEYNNIVKSSIDMCLTYRLDNNNTFFGYFFSFCHVLFRF
jgi:ATP-dependent 26S proteasome regulatory subunit